MKFSVQITRVLIALQETHFFNAMTDFGSVLETYAPVFVVLLFGTKIRHIDMVAFCEVSIGKFKDDLHSLIMLGVHT